MIEGIILKKEKAVEVLAEGSESVLKTLINSIPGVGSALNEVIFECRSRIKQNRINNFVTELSKYIEEHSENIDLEYIKSEEFGDILESIFKEVFRTSAQDKLNRFKMILVNQMNPENYTEFTETFLDIITKLNEKEIEILDYYNKNKDEYNAEKHKIFNIDENLFTFYIQDLISKCLMTYCSVGRYDKPTLSVVEITQFGRGLLSFIKAD